MIREARAASKDFDNVLYCLGIGTADSLGRKFFDKVLSVESFYYYADQDRALMELFRVMAPQGRLFHPDQSIQGQPILAAVGGTC